MKTLKPIAKECLKRLPGFRKLAWYFLQTRQLIAQYDSLVQENNKLVQEISSLAHDNNVLREEMAAFGRKLSLERESLDLVKASLVKFANQDKRNMPRLAVYTVLMGNYDILSTPDFIDPECDYFCITNNREIRSTFWNMIYVENENGLDNTRFQRMIKIFPHRYFPHYEHSLYIDASILIRNSVIDWINTYSTGKSLLVHQHPERNCIYDEAEVCKWLKKDDDIKIDQQMERYRLEEVPRNVGLVWSAILYRKHNDLDLIKIEQMWNEEIQRGSRRDQLSFNYVCWKSGFEYDSCPPDYHEYFLWASLHNGVFH